MLKRIAVLVSGGGTNLQALIDAQADGRLKSGRIVRVISSKPDAYALTRADRAGIPTTVVPRKQYASRQAYDEAVLAALEEAQADLVILAGFLYVLGPRVIRAYPDRIINVHPALIPSFCGDGFYGLKVHEAALAYGVKVTGATVHLVNEVTDGGRILLQKAVEVQEGDTPETLQAEWVLLPQAAEMLCKKLQEEQDG